MCCKNVNLSEETQWLDRGDGICKHLDTKDNDCKIYDSRPDICNVRVQYKNKYSKEHSWEGFVELNVQVCNILKGLE